MLHDYSHDLRDSPPAPGRVMPSPEASYVRQYKATYRPSPTTPHHKPPPLYRLSFKEFIYILGTLLASVVFFGGMVYLFGIQFFGNSPNRNLTIFVTASTLIFIASFIFTLIILRLRGRTWQQIGFRTPSIVWVFGGIFLGIIFVPIRIALILFIAALVDMPTVPTSSPESTSAEPQLDMLLILAGLQIIFLLIVMAPLAEELLFRGVIYSWLSRRFGIGAAVVTSSFIFGLAHVDPLIVISNSVMGVVLALAYEYSRTLWIPMLIHFVNNSIVFGFLVLAAMFAV